MDTALVLAMLTVNVVAIVSVAIRLERRLTKLETDQAWLIEYIRNTGPN